MIDLLILILILALVVVLYVLGELQHYARGNDVYDWTARLAEFLKAHK